MPPSAPQQPAHERIRPGRIIETLAVVDGYTRGRPFWAGIVLWSIDADGERDDPNRDVVIQTAPVCKRFQNWTRQQVRSYVGKQHPRWTVSVVVQTEREAPEWWTNNRKSRRATTTSRSAK